ncbi:hypothetical protein FQA39_LY16958 [Lamprigera yunnana]|nr:hypothetical protein FQA39_LY16958 [Lamprigera yunnana]
MYTVSGGDVQNKFMYVKQEFLQSIKQGQSRVLINPNFGNVVHVNPHFNKQFVKNQTIHINPNAIRNHTIPTPQVPSTHMEKPKNKVVIVTPTKLIRSARKSVLSPRLRRVSIHTKYKIIRNSTVKSKINRNDAVKNRFAIDRRLPHLKKDTVKNMKTKNKHINLASKRGHQTKCNVNSKSNLKLKILTIRGQKYKMNSSHHTLTLINNSKKLNEKPLFKTVYVGGMTFKRKESNVFVKTKTRSHNPFSRQFKQKSTNASADKLKKSNLPCPFYRKFGKCKGNEAGKCIRLHNPEQISLCAKFLQGACTKTNCLLSHKVSAEKMPTCRFFLEGRCSKDDCPYLHVKINNKADLCKDFLEGFCKKGAECDKRHQYLCTDFEKTGRCVKKNCQYPHGDVVRSSTFTKFVEKLQGQNLTKAHAKVNLDKLIEKKKLLTSSNDSEEKAIHSRYYSEFTNSNVESICNDTYDDEGSNKCSKAKISRRPQLGSLPSFIPLSDKQNKCDF